MKIRSLSALLLLLSMVFVSCLKTRDETGLVDDKNGSTIVEITDVSYNNLYGQDQVIAMDVTPTQETVTAFTLKYQAGRKAPSNDIRVKLTTTGSVPTGYTALPASAVTFPAEITIPRSVDRTVEVPITINKAGLDLTKNYALTFKISEVSEGVISELGSEITVFFVIKNKYDGKYNVTGSLVDALGVYSGIYPRTGVGLRTAGPNSVDYIDPQYNVGAPYGNNAYIMQNTATAAAAWLFSPRFIFDATDKVTSVYANDYGATYGTPVAGGPNQFTYTSATSKSFQIKYTTNAGRFTITETYTYTGPR